MRRRPIGLVVSLLLIISAAAACRQVLDIQPATLDEELAGSSDGDNRLEVDASSETGSSDPADAGDSDPENDNSEPEDSESDDESDNEESDDEESDDEESDDESQGDDTADDQDAGEMSTAGHDASLPPAEEDTDAGQGPPVEADLCTTYCDTLQANCTDEYEQYQQNRVCLSVCRLLEEGEEGDRDVNTVQCRMRHADLAALEPFTHCTFAGLLGHDECGSNCEAFCDVMMLACRQDNTLQSERYPTRQACMTDCAGVPDLGYFTTFGEAGMFEGDHIQCRGFHVAAAILEADLHCEHSIGGTPCDE